MRLGRLWLIGLIVLCSACAAKQVPQAPVVVVPVVECPMPALPVLPDLYGGLPFDHPSNVEVLMERDDTMRAYIKGLRAACKCYLQQLEVPAGD